MVEKVDNSQRNTIFHAIWVGGKKMNKMNLKRNEGRQAGRLIVSENVLNGKGEIGAQRKIVLRGCPRFPKMFLLE